MPGSSPRDASSPERYVKRRKHGADATYVIEDTAPAPPATPAASNPSPEGVDYRTLVEQIPCITYTEVHEAGISKGQRTTYVSPQATRILGHAPAEFIADPELWRRIRHPADHLLGGETGGVEKIGSILSEIRVMTAAISVGIARAAYAAALDYARERVAFEKPIVEHQAIGFKLADMLTQLHAATLLTYQAAARLDAGRAITREAAMAKLFASEMAVRVTDEAARIFASYGLAMEYPVQRYFRDARFLLPGGGTSEILRVVIDRDLDWDRGEAFA